MRFRAFLPLVLVVSSALGGQSTVRSYGIQGVGTLELEVPLRWKEEIGWTDGDHRPSVTFRPEEGEAFVMSVAVLPPPVDAPPGFGSVEWMKGLVGASARKALGVDDATDLGLEQIGEAQAVGWYYSVTDSALPDPPPSGTFRVMTQGASAASGVVLTSTILTQKAWGSELDDALRVLSSARVTSHAPDAWRVPGKIVLDRGGEGQRYALETPEGFDRESSAPLSLRDRETGGTLTVDVVATTSRPAVRDELRRLEQEIDRRSPGAWITRKRGPALLDGKPAARLVVVDELRDQLVESWSLPLSDAVITLTWRVDPRREREGEPRLRALLDAFHVE